MEELPRSDRRVRAPLTVPVLPYWRDHCLGAGAVLPAVEALQILARSLPAGAGTPLVQEEASFPHLLVLAPDQEEITLYSEQDSEAGGRGWARLLTLRQGRQGAWCRAIEHACLRFSSATAARQERAAWAGPAERGEAFVFPASRLYEELVPFGPAYRNTVGEVCLDPQGAWAQVTGGEKAGAEGPLGSPFPFDAAMHLACAWGQRYRGQVTFPVAFRRRQIFAPTQTGKSYLCQVSWRGEDARGIYFDLALSTAEGERAEQVEGLAMRPLARERRQPPAWIREGQG
jgi:hypothetical protein